MIKSDMGETKQPTIEEVKDFLQVYGWNFRETETNGEKVLIAPYITAQNQGVLVSFQVQGEFVMVSTIGLLKNIPNGKTRELLLFADRIKLVKIFAVDDAGEGMVNADMGFELWAESWNDVTFFAFMDALGMGIERMLQRVEEAEIPHETNWVQLSG